MSKIPTSQMARQIAAEVFGEQVSSCTRFETGLRHWVYDVVLQSGQNIVVRLSHPDNRAELAGGVYWHQHLEHVGIPAAPILAHSIDSPQPFMILERLDGTDLGNCFDDLNDAQLQQISASIVEMQQLSSRLPHGSGYGYALNYESPLHPTWHAVLQKSIDRSDRWIRDAGVVDTAWATRVRTKLDSTSTTLDDVSPEAFLHDATTKNVIVSNGTVTGIVDIDEMAFGDPLWTTALTKMSLLSAHRPTNYADEQAAALNPKADDRMDLYTAIHALGFLAEIGQQVNQAEPAPVDTEHKEHLEATLASML